VQVSVPTVNVSTAQMMAIGKGKQATRQQVRGFVEGAIQEALEVKQREYANDLLHELDGDVQIIKAYPIAAECGSHLGASARFTGKDISGQPDEE